MVIRHNPIRIIGNRQIMKLPDWGKGIPDLIAIPPATALPEYRGKFVSFEIKAAKGQQSEYQLARENEIKSRFGHYFIIRSVEDFVETCNMIMGRKIFLF